MWKPNKTTLFTLMILSALIGGISLSFADWTIIDQGNFKDIYYELASSFILIGCGFVFMLNYVEKLKEEKK